MTDVLDPAAYLGGESQDVATASEDAPLCAVPGCDQHAVPDSPFCGREDHDELSADPMDGTSGSVAGAVGSSSYQDGTGRSKKPRYRHRKAAKDTEELRVVSEKKNIVTVEGYSARYNVSYDVHDFMGTFRETMMPGAFAGVVNNDVRFLFNHDGLPLARTTNGTMTLRSDNKGLWMRASVDTDNTIAADLVSAIERGDVSQQSIGFIVDREGDVWDDDYTVRHIYRVAELLDCSAVTYPASPTTNIALATSAEDVRFQYKRQQVLRDRRLQEARRVALMNQIARYR